MSTQVSAAELLELAERATTAAGTLLVERRPAGGPDVTRTKSSPTDVVTAMDTAAERAIVAVLRQARPADAVLAEEESAADGRGVAGDSGVRWVIDPIDGTVNYLYGLPDWGVSVAAEAGGEVVAGVVHVPTRGELFAARRGAGAWLNGAPLRCNSAVPLDRALVATGFGYASSRRAEQAEVLRGLLPVIRDVRRGGASSVDLCSVASGRVDGYYERGLAPWDFAAGALVAREAGAWVGGARGQPPGEHLLLAAPPGLFEALHARLVEFDFQL